MGKAGGHLSCCTDAGDMGEFIVKLLALCLGPFPLGDFRPQIFNPDLQLSGRRLQLLVHRAIFLSVIIQPSRHPPECRRHTLHLDKIVWQRFGIGILAPRDLVGEF